MTEKEVIEELSKFANIHPNVIREKNDVAIFGCRNMIDFALYLSKRGVLDGVNGSFFSEEVINSAAEQDYNSQTRYDDAYDRKKGFIKGVKWAISRILSNR